MIRRFGWFGILLGVILCSNAYAQNESILGTSVIQNTAVEEPVPVGDTLPDTIPDEQDLEKITDLRGQFLKQNSTYSAPRTLNERLLRFLKKDELEISDEALYWARLVRDASTLFDEHVTFQDTVIVNPLFLPAVFRGEYLPEDLTFYDFSALKERTPYDHLYPTDTIFRDELRVKKIEDNAYRFVQDNYPTYFHYSFNELPKEHIKAKVIKKSIYEDMPIKITNDASFEDVDAPEKFIPDRRYWTSHFESSVQFAQNYISPNWHKGGVSALNLTNRQYFVYNYNKDKVQFTNELEWKTNVYTAPKDTLRDYKIGDDVVRLHSNIGYKAFEKWYYTFDATFQTQLFSNYNENTNDKKVGFLAPFNINLGLGMKYDLNKSFASNKYRKLTLAANLAPISYTYTYTIDRDIILKAQFQPNEDGTYPYKQSKFGSTINATMNFQVNRNVSLYSRFYYFTSYDRMQGEFENRLNMAISRFFSTTISLYLRYDDGVAKNEDFKSYFQINELLSFGFNYKW